jgi:hypothetical protein
MADNTKDWRERPPKGMYATVVARRCGWHVLLYSTGPTVNSRLRPTLLGWSCVAYKVDPTKETMLTQAQALVIGAHSIMDGVENVGHPQ